MSDTKPTLELYRSMATDDLRDLRQTFSLERKQQDLTPANLAFCDHRLALIKEVLESRGEEEYA